MGVGNEETSRWERGDEAGRWIGVCDHVVGREGRRCYLPVRDI